MSVRFSAELTGANEVMAALLGLSKGQAAQAFAKAMNDTGFEGRRAMQAEIQRVFDRPTPYIVRSPRFKRAKASDLSIVIEPTYMGGKGVDPQKILQAQEWGGTRVDKKSEVLLRRAGILPPGYQTVIPADKYGGPFPGSVDAYGNIKGSFIVHLLSYFSSFDEGGRGHDVNMTDKLKGRWHRGTKKRSARKYFVAYGKLRDSPRTTGKGEPDRRANTRRPGIWATSGAGGVNLQPVLLFVKKGVYKPRLSMQRVSDQADLYNYLQRRVRYRFREAAGV